MQILKAVILWTLSTVTCALFVKPIDRLKPAAIRPASSFRYSSKNASWALDDDWKSDCPIPNTQGTLVYKYGPEAPRWAIAYTISGAKLDVRRKMQYYHKIEDPYFYESSSHQRAYLNMASYAGYPKHLTWEMILDTITAVGDCTIGRGQNRTIHFHVAFPYARVASGELGYLPFMPDLGGD